MHHGSFHPITFKANNLLLLKLRIEITKTTQCTFRVPNWVPKSELDEAIVAIEKFQTCVSNRHPEHDSIFMTLSSKDPVSLHQSKNILQTLVDAGNPALSISPRPGNPLSPRETNRHSLFGFRL